MFMDGTLCLITLHGSVILGQVQQDREEIAWVERAQVGDEAGYRCLLDRYRDRVIRVAAATLGGTTDAEDVAQEAFIRAFRMIGKLEKKSSFYGWVCKIAVRICLDKKRLKSAHELPFSTVAATACYSDSTNSTDTVMLVWQILNELPPSMRAALVLRELDGLDYAEIAALLFVPVGTVRSRLSTARTKFKALWEEANRPVEVKVHVRY